MIFSIAPLSRKMSKFSFFGKFGPKKGPKHMPKYINRTLHYLIGINGLIRCAKYKKTVGLDYEKIIFKSNFVAYRQYRHTYI